VLKPNAAPATSSAFAAIFPAAAPLWFYPITLLLIGVLSLGWHIGLAQVFGSSALRDGYLRIERAINGWAGGALVALGFQRMFAR